MKSCDKVAIFTAKEKVGPYISLREFTSFESFIINNNNTLIYIAPACRMTSEARFACISVGGSDP